MALEVLHLALVLQGGFPAGERAEIFALARLLALLLRRACTHPTSPCGSCDAPDQRSTPLRCKPQMPRSIPKGGNGWRRCTTGRPTAFVQRFILPRASVQFGSGAPGGPRG